jgi:hypothetical protein
MGVKIMLKAHIVLLSLLTLQSAVFPASQLLQGKQYPFGKIVDHVQYIKKGEALLNLSEAPIVATFNEANNSIRLTCPEAGSPDSLYYLFVPGDLIKVRIAAEVHWNDSLGMFQYSYSIISDSSSRIPIDGMQTDQLFECWKYKSPLWWIGYYNRRLRFQSWHQFKESLLLMPGQSLSGFGYESKGPPTLGNFSIEGQNKVIDSAGEDEFFALAYSEIINQHRAVDGITLIPGPQQERIEAPAWVMNILNNLGILQINGYIPDTHLRAVEQIVTELQQSLRYLQKRSFDDWSPYIDAAIDSLTAYQTLIQPEAYAYITENLKYMQRHKDIVWFGKYVPPPEQK